jgi:hypothetical protein
MLFFTAVYSVLVRRQKENIHMFTGHKRPEGKGSF